MLGRVYAIASSAFCRGVMKEELLHVGGSEEAVAEVPVESGVGSASYFTEGLLAMHRREVLEVRVGGPRIIWSQGEGKLCDKTVEIVDSPVSSPRVKQFVERPNSTSDSSTSGATTLLSTSSWSGTVFFLVVQSLCMPACKIFVLARKKKPPDRPSTSSRRETDKGTKTISTHCLSIMLLLFRTPTLCFSLSLLQLGDGRIETETRNYNLFAFECFACCRRLPTNTLSLCYCSLAMGIGMRRRRVTIFSFVCLRLSVCLLPSSANHSSFSLLLQLVDGIELRRRRVTISCLRVSVLLVAVVCQPILFLFVIAAWRRGSD
jgi:hypothetical protein